MTLNKPLGLLAQAGTGVLLRTAHMHWRVYIRACLCGHWALRWLVLCLTVHRPTSPAVAHAVQAPVEGVVLVAAVQLPSAAATLDSTICVTFLLQAPGGGWRA